MKTLVKNPDREQIEGLWALGYSAQEIAIEAGWKVKNPRAVIARLRERGWELPIRNERSRA